MAKEYWVLNKLRRKRKQPWMTFCAEFIPYGLSHMTVFRAATGRCKQTELTQDQLDRYIRDHQDEIDRVEVADEVG